MLKASEGIKWFLDRVPVLESRMVGVEQGSAVARHVLSPRKPISKGHILWRLSSFILNHSYWCQQKQTNTHAH
eukprot:4781948-Pleurochrysis_carterae.AAC.1